MSPASSPETIDVDQMASFGSPEPAPDPGKEGGNGTLRTVLVSLAILGIVGFTTWKIHRNFEEQNPTDIERYFDRSAEQRAARRL